MFIAYTHNLFHIIGVLILVTPISTWFYQLTGNIYLGAILNAALVTWMFVSSQVVAPIPVWGNAEVGMRKGENRIQRTESRW